MAPKKPIILWPLFKVYRYLISPALQVGFDIRCRFDESCSLYTERMISERGVFKGSWLGLKRILTCNKWSA